MKNLGLSGVLLATILTIGHSAGASKTTPVALPTAAERLAQPISFADCRGLRVIEWRASKEFPFTAHSSDGEKVIGKACKTAFTKYPDFLRSKGLTFREEAFTIDMSLIPANTIADGKEPRNMNDVDGRFQIVQPNCCSWGIYDYSLSYLFLRNDPISIVGGKNEVNKYFVRTFLHEMAHVFNDKWHVKEAYFPNAPDKDEALAEEWVSYLGIKFKTESSSEDWSFKKHGS